MLPTVKTFVDALYLARTAEGQEKQLGAIHHRNSLGQRDGSGEHGAM